jgi:hypothetical protein
MLQCLHFEQQCPWNPHILVQTDLGLCNLFLLKWLFIRGVTRATFADALNSYHMSPVGQSFVGSIAILAWLHSTELLRLDELEQQQYAVNAAIAGGHTGTVQWLRAKVAHFTETTVRDLELLDVRASTQAARSGHYDMVKLLHEQSLATDGFASTMSADAVESGSLQLLAYLIEQGIGSWHPVGDDGVAVENFLENCVQIAGLRGHAELLPLLREQLREQGAQWPEQLWQREIAADAFSVVSCWALPALQCAIAAGCPLGAWPVGLCDELIANNYAEEVEWLHTLEMPPCGANCTAKQAV